MQGLWYGDKRDRVKWGALVHLANTKGIRCIIQVAYFRHGTDLMLQIGENEVPLPIEVWNHFSNLRHIERLSNKTGLNIIVLDQDLHNKSDYIHMITSHIIAINKDIKGRKIIFLDPDTGIEPEKSSGLEHVTKNDLDEIWKVLSEGDLLVIYQHADRTKKWLPKRKEKMSHSCGGADIGTITGTGIASDVAILWVCKGPTPKSDPKMDLADPEPRKTSKKQKTPRSCAHQCGEMTKGGYFYPGHDAKLKSLFLRVSRGEKSKKELDKISLKMYEIWEKDKNRPLIDIAREVLGENEHGQNSDR